MSKPKIFNYDVPVEHGSLKSLGARRVGFGALEKQAKAVVEYELPASAPLVDAPGDSGEPAGMVLLSPPNAIGICTLKYRLAVVKRHVNRVQPRNDKAREMLAAGSAGVVARVSDFVGRLEGSAVGKVTQAETPFLPQVEVRHVEQVLEYLVARRAEYAAVKNKKAGEVERLHLLCKYAKEWQSEARRQGSAAEAGIAANEYGNPCVLIKRLMKLVAMLRKQPDGNPPIEIPKEEQRLITAAGDYLQKHWRVED